MAVCKLHLATPYAESGQCVRQCRAYLRGLRELGQLVRQRRTNWEKTIKKVALLSGWLPCGQGFRLILYSAQHFNKPDPFWRPALRRCANAHTGNGDDRYRADDHRSISKKHQSIVGCFRKGMNGWPGPW